MKRVLITGANGFIGKNLYWRLNQFGRPKKILVEKGCSNQKWNNREKNNLKWNNQDETLEILSYDIDNAWEELCDFINRADFIFHLAGINRSKRNEDFETGNKCFTEKLVNILENTGKNTPLLISSSIQAAQDNPYGASKKVLKRLYLNMVEGQVPEFAYIDYLMYLVNGAVLTIIQ